MTIVLRLDPRTGLMRGARGAALTVPAVALAVLAHSAGGGCVTWLGVLTSLGLCWPAAVAVLARPARALVLAGWLLLAQLVTHTVLEWLCADAAAGHQLSREHVATGLVPKMLLMHGVATLLTAVVLARADARLWAARTLLRAAARAVRLVQRCPSLTRPVVSTPAPCPPVVPVLRDRWKGPHPKTRRGPPSLLLAGVFPPSRRSFPASVEAASRLEILLCVPPVPLLSLSCALPSQPRPKVPLRCAFPATPASSSQPSWPR